MDIDIQLENLRKRKQQASDSYKRKMDSLKSQKENINRQILNAKEQHSREMNNYEQQEIFLKKAELNSKSESIMNLPGIRRITETIKSLCDDFEEEPLLYPHSC